MNTKKLQGYIVGFGVLIMLIVVMSLVLTNFKTSGIACSDTQVYNSTSDLCANTANQSQTNDPGGIFAGLDTAVTAFQEPANWVEIVVIALIGAGIVALFFGLYRKKGFGSGGNKGMSGGF